MGVEDAARETERLKRINELAKKQKEVGLTDDERKEQALLRAEYLAAFRRNLEAELNNTYIVDPDGTKHKLEKKSEK